MKQVFLLLTVAVCLFSRCSNLKTTDEPLPAIDTSAQVQIIPTFDTLAEKQAIQELFQECYRRLNTLCRTPDFEPLEDETGTYYVGLNLDIHQKRLKELRAIALLDSQFIQHYDAIAKRIDSALKHETLSWAVGQLQPFGNGANPWINAQDHPNAYWHNIHVEILSINPEKARLTWGWDSSMHYPAEAKKYPEGWKVSRLSGFDEAYFFTAPAIDSTASE